MSPIDRTPRAHTSPKRCSATSVLSSGHIVSRTRATIAPRRDRNRPHFERPAVHRNSRLDRAALGAGHASFECHAGEHGFVLLGVDAGKHDGGDDRSMAVRTSAGRARSPLSRPSRFDTLAQVSVAPRPDDNRQIWMTRELQRPVAEQNGSATTPSLTQRQRKRGDDNVAPQSSRSNSGIHRLPPICPDLQNIGGALFGQFSSKSVRSASFPKPRGLFGSNDLPIVATRSCASDFSLDVANSPEPSTNGRHRSPRTIPAADSTAIVG